MGFWSDMAKSAGKKIADAHQQLSDTVDEYRSKDNDFLQRKLKTGTQMERTVALKILKERGLL